MGTGFCVHGGRDSLAPAAGAMIPGITRCILPGIPATRSSGWPGHACPQSPTAFIYKAHRDPTGKRCPTTQTHAWPMVATPWRSTSPTVSAARCIFFPPMTPIRGMGDAGGFRGVHIQRRLRRRTGWHGHISVLAGAFLNPHRVEGPAPNPLPYGNIETCVHISSLDSSPLPLR